MSRDIRKWMALLLMGAAIGGLFPGCRHFVPRKRLRQSQIQTYRIYHQNRQLCSDLGSMQMSLGQMEMSLGQIAAEKQQAESLAAGLQQNLEAAQREIQVANQRIENLAQERSKLHGEYKNLLTSLPSPDNPLNGAASRRFEELARKYPDFEFDPITGVSKFNGDLLFATGSSQVRPEGLKLLQEFSEIMNSGDARQFNILVVGHTDDQPVVTPGTRAKHETNWELSAHRATAVVRQLAKYGLAEPRMGVAGYSMHQPKVPNKDEGSRQENRRVEIFILAADASVAGREIKPLR
ncbi:MAG: OmpA family protein [Planctomycetaceae bacterium]|nr:OmpA family protein [Planctomycetaceae bacterium]